MLSHHFQNPNTQRTLSQQTIVFCFTGLLDYHLQTKIEGGLTTYRAGKTNWQPEILFLESILTTLKWPNSLSRAAECHASHGGSAVHPQNTDLAAKTAASSRTFTSNPINCCFDTAPPKIGLSDVYFRRSSKTSKNSLSSSSATTPLRFC